MRISEVPPKQTDFFLLPVMPSDMDRLYTHSCVYNYKKQRYISDLNLDNLCICGIFCTSVRPEQRSDPGRKHLTGGSPSGFIFFPRRVFPDEVEGLTTQSTDLQDLQGQLCLEFEAQHNFFLIWL